MRVVLTGFMGTGKSVVGQRVADRLGRTFADTDSLVERRTGRTVREIFATDGEAAFRDREREAVREACALGDVVVATGGGALMDERNLARLSDGGFLVCLTAAPAVIARRVRATAADRPLLGSRVGLTARIRELLAARAATYARIPFAVDTSGKTIDQVADEVIAALADAERTGRRAARGSGSGSGSGDGPRGRRPAGKAAAR